MSEYKNNGEFNLKETKESRQIRYTESRKKLSLSSLISLIAYIGIGCIALALILTLIFKGDTKVSSIFQNIGEVIAYILSIILAYSWVKDHKKIGWIVCYVIFVVTIVILFVLTI